LQLKFNDNGTGMPEDIKQKIFEPFFSTKGAHGTGLGLSVSHRIIERHEGTINVISEPRQGTTFVIDLPAALTETALVGPVATSDLTPHLRILVVDDEP